MCTVLVQYLMVEGMLMDKKTFYEPQRDYRADILDIIRSGKSDEEVGLLLEDYHDNDIAAVLDKLTLSERERLLRVLGNEGMSEVVTYLDDAGEYISELDAEEAADIIEQMDADDALDVLEDLDESVRRELLELIDDEEIKEDIEKIDSYAEDEFGSKMSTNFISISSNMTVKQAMRALIADAPENDNIYTLFVLDDSGKFYGAIDLKELIVARSDTPLEDLIYKNFPYVYDTDSISENVERVRGYSEDLIPVISQETGALLGVITSVDLVEIVDEERGDDYAKLAALSSEEERDEPLSKSIRKRVPWLIVLLFLGLAVSAVVGLFEGVVSELPMIVAFQSLILGMAGNVGTQSLAVTVRALGSEEDLGVKRQLAIIFRETRVALLNGILLGAFSFAIVGAYLAFLSGAPLSVAFTTAACVSAALCFAMTISGFTGAAIPLCFFRLGIGPAVASGPLITTVNDLVAVVSYYGLAWLMLMNLV